MLCLMSRLFIQVISNFVSNAAKFTAEGGQVKMSAMLCEPETTLQPPALDSIARIRIAVTDSGIGISEDDQVFESNLLVQLF